MNLIHKFGFDAFFSNFVKRKYVDVKFQLLPSDCMLIPKPNVMGEFFWDYWIVAYETKFWHLLESKNNNLFYESCLNAKN